MKWLGSILLGLFIVIVIIVGIRYFQYQNDVEKLAEQLPGDSIVAQTAEGPVAYLVQYYSNNHVLLLHGSLAVTTLLWQMIL